MLESPEQLQGPVLSRSSSERQTLMDLHSDGQPFSWPSSLLVLEDAASCSVLVSAYFRLQLPHSPPRPLLHTAFASAPAAACLMIFLILMFDSEKAGDRKRKRKWLWLGTCIHPCSSFSSRWPLSAVLPFSCFVFVHTTLVVPSSPPTQHLHRCSWVRLEESTQVSESCWLTWNSWSWTSREYSVLSSSHSVFH